MLLHHDTRDKDIAMHALAKLFPRSALEEQLECFSQVAEAFSTVSP